MGDTCTVKGAPDPIAWEVYRGLLCFRKILQKPTDSVPQQDCEYQKLKSGCENLPCYGHFNCHFSVWFFSEVN